MRMNRVSWILCSLLSVGLMTAGCVDFERECDTSHDPDARTEVCNDPDSFLYNKEGEGHTSQEEYFWENTNGVAELRWTPALEDGEVTLVLLDADGQEVHQDQWTPSDGDPEPVTSSQGTPGPWSLRLVFSDFTGRVDLLVSGVGSDQADAAE